jgi:uncharacterized membrane protein
MAACAQGCAVRNVLAGALALALSACNARHEEATPAPVEAPAAPVAPVSTAPITHTGHGLRGQAVMGKDGFGIVPCGESTQRIMEISPSAKPFLDKYLAQGAHEFFVEAEGRDLDNGHVFVTRFHRLYSDGPGCKAQLDPAAFVAWGNEPFWAATDTGGSLRLERPGAEPLLAPSSEVREENGDWIVEGEIGAAGKLSLRMTPGFCSDGMSDALYAWSAKANFGDTELKGCGFPGFERKSR